MNAVITENGKIKTLKYYYSEDGSVSMKIAGGVDEEYSCSVNATTQEKTINCSDGVFIYNDKKQLIKHNQAKYDYKIAFNYILGTLGAPLFFDSVRISEENDRIVTVRNTWFGDTKMRTEHILYSEQSSGSYVLQCNKIYTYDDSANQYLPNTDFTARQVCRIEYLDSKHFLQEEILDDVFQLRDYIEHGTGHAVIHPEEVYYLEDKLPHLLPGNITTKNENIEFVYEMDFKGLLSKARITRRDKHGFPISVKTVKFNYSHDREGV